MPRQHYNPGSKQDIGVLTGHVGQELNRFRTHGVVVEMMLNRPQRFEAEFDG